MDTETLKAVNAKPGSHYLSGESKISVRMWRVVGDKAYVYIPSIAKIIDVPTNYSLLPDTKSNDTVSTAEVTVFLDQMNAKFKKDYPKVDLDAPQPTKKEAAKKEEVPLADRPSGRSDRLAPKTKKQIRGELKAQIDSLKLERKELSEKNAEIKEKMEKADKTERKVLGLQVRDNVKKRGQMSDEIKSISQKIRDLKVAPTA